MESDQSDRRRRCQRRFQRHHGDIITFLNADDDDDDESHAISDQSYRIVVIITILDLDQTGRGGSDG